MATASSRARHRLTLNFIPASREQPACNTAALTMIHSWIQVFANEVERQVSERRSAWSRAACPAATLWGARRSAMRKHRFDTPGHKPSLLVWIAGLVYFGPGFT